MKTLFCILIVSTLLMSCTKRVNLVTTNNAPFKITVYTPGSSGSDEVFSLDPYQAHVNLIELSDGGFWGAGWDRGPEPLEIDVLQPTNFILTASLTTNYSGSNTNISTNQTTNSVTFTSWNFQSYDSLPSASKSAPIQKFAFVSYIGNTNISGFTYNVFKVDIYPK